jgi:hypothetical protein
MIQASGERLTCPSCGEELKTLVDHAPQLMECPECEEEISVRPEESGDFNVCGPDEDDDEDDEDIVDEDDLDDMDEDLDLDELDDDAVDGAIEDDDRALSGILSVLLSFLLLTSACFAQSSGVQVRADHPNLSPIDNRPVTTEEYGCGVFVSKHRVLTCFHIVAEGTKFFIKPTPKADWIEVKLIDTDEKNDLAMLRCEAEGEPVEIVSMPDLVISGSAKREDVHDTPVTTNNAVLYVGPYDPKDAKGEKVKMCGQSGSPILAEGRMIGIVKTQLTKTMANTLYKNTGDEPGIYAIITSADVILKFMAK